MIRMLGSLWRSNQRPALIVAGVTLGVGLVSAGALLGWSNLRLRHATMVLQAEQQAMADAALAREELALLDSELPRRESRSRALRASGFLDAADRVAWAESVAQVARNLNPLSYTAAISTSQWLPLPDAQSAWYATHGLATPSLQATDLVLRIQGLHEGELGRLLDTAIRAGGGITRIEHCELVRRSDDVGIDTECRLRRFGLGEPPVEPSPDEQHGMENPS